MKDIRLFQAPKYSTKSYNKIENGIYEINREYVLSISFIQEPQLGEGSSAIDISQYPLEDVLEHFFVYVSDFYKDLNTGESSRCYLELCSEKLSRIQRLKDIVGKHIYNKTSVKEGHSVVELIFE